MVVSSTEYVVGMYSTVLLRMYLGYSTSVLRIKSTIIIITIASRRPSGL